jgi:hypothetical protein
MSVKSRTAYTQRVTTFDINSNRNMKLLYSINKMRQRISVFFSAFEVMVGIRFDSI